MIKHNITNFIFCLFFILPLILPAQVKPFGVVSPEEFTAKYPGAEAEILFDQGINSFTYPNGEIKLAYNRHVRILINAEDGFDWGDLFLPFYVESNRRETIYNIKASTYHLSANGKIESYPLEKAAIFEEKKDKNRRAKRFAMPQLKPGCIIEFSYQKESDYLGNVTDWIFQDRVPVHWSDYQIKIPPMFEFFVNPENIDSFFIKEEKKEKHSKTYRGVKFQDMTYRWVLTDIPAWKKEAMSTSLTDHYPRINFQISRFESPTGHRVTFAQNWKSFSKEMLSDYYLGKHLSPSRAVKELSKELGAQLKTKTALEKIKLIRRFVATQFEYSGRRSIRPKHSQKKFVKIKKGNSADINLLLYNLLSLQDFNVRPLLLSTIDHGRVNSNFPFRSDYNYILILCQLEGAYLLLDATDPERPYHLLPEYCLTDRGLILEKKESKWFNIPHTPTSKVTKTTSFLIQEDNSITGRTSWTLNNHAAYRQRRHIKRDGEAAYQANLAQELLAGELEIQETDLLHLNDIDKDLKIKTTFTVDNDQEDIIYLPPFAKTDADLLKVFTEEERQYPIHWDFLQENYYTTRIVIKGDYDVLEYPQSTSIVFPDGSVRFSLSSILENNILTIRCKLSIKKLDFHKNAYPAFKEIFNLIEKKQNEFVVLKKKG